MKRVCFLMDSIFSIGGVQRVTAVIARELSVDHDVTIVTFDAPEAEDRSLYGLGKASISYQYFAYPAVGKVKTMICKAYSMAFRKFLPQNKITSYLYSKSSFPSERRQALARCLAGGHYDTIIGVHAPLAARLATLAPQLKGTRLIGWVHNSFEALFNPSSLYIGPELKRHYVYQLMKLDDTVVLCQHDARQYRDYDARFKPVVIYNPLTLTPGRLSEGQSRRFLAVGRFSPRHKGFDLLIEAFARFAQTDATWQLDIVGGGPEEEALRQQIADCGMSQRIHLHPFTNRIQSYYEAAQVYVLSSRWEGFGLVLVEAMAHGLPVVSSDLPTSLEIMGDFGIYFRNGDVDDLAQRLADATRIDWPAQSAEALRRCSRFSIAAIMSQWRNIIGSV